LDYHILYSIYTRDMMDCVVASSEVDLALSHSLQYLYSGYDGLCHRLEWGRSCVTTFFTIFILGIWWIVSSSQVR